MIHPIALATYFTRGWTYSIPAWGEHVAAALAGEGALVILATDDSPEAATQAAAVASRLPACHVRHEIVPDLQDEQKAYGEAAQLVIARLQQRAFSVARAAGVSQLWSVESDVLVPPNALKVLRQVLDFDDSYYSIAMVTYPNGQFLGGRGTPQQPIAEDFTQEERVIPADLQKELGKKEARLRELGKRRQPAGPEELEAWGELDKKIRECPPRGNIFAMQAKGWRRRGWMEAAYPGIGRGAVLPTDWVGLGCTLLNRRALDLATFDGYELKGTQDLFLCWNRWHPAGLRMAVIPHILCSHVKRRVLPDGTRTQEIEVHEAYHEMEGEHVGHIRWRPRAFHPFHT